MCPMCQNKGPFGKCEFCKPKPAQGESVQKIAEELTIKIAGQIDAHLFESIVSLFNAGVLVHYVRSPRSNVDTNNFRLTVEGASGVKFEGREKIIELTKERDALKAKELMLLTSLGSSGELIEQLKAERDEALLDVEIYKSKASNWQSRAMLAEQELGRINQEIRKNHE